MFPLSCARVHTGCETSARNKTWSAQNILLQKCVCTYFMHIFPYTDESWYNVAQKKLFAHTDVKKLEGTLVLGRRCTRPLGLPWKRFDYA